MVYRDQGAQETYYCKHEQVYGMATIGTFHKPWWSRFTILSDSPRTNSVFDFVKYITKVCKLDKCSSRRLSPLIHLVDYRVPAPTDTAVETDLSRPASTGVVVRSSAPSCVPSYVPYPPPGVCDCGVPDICLCVSGCAS
jgi:hypothetical protein